VPEQHLCQCQAETAAPWVNSSQTGVPRPLPLPHGCNYQVLLQAAPLLHFLERLLLLLHALLLLPCCCRRCCCCCWPSLHTQPPPQQPCCLQQSSSSPPPPPKKNKEILGHTLPTCCRCPPPSTHHHVPVRGHPQPSSSNNMVSPQPASTRPHTHIVSSAYFPWFHTSTTWQHTRGCCVSAHLAGSLHSSLPTRLPTRSPTPTLHAVSAAWCHAGPPARTHCPPYGKTAAFTLLMPRSPQAHSLHSRHTL